MGISELRGQTLARLMEKLAELPVLPAVVVRLMGMSPESESYFDEVLSLAESDPPFAARVITAANSVASAPVAPVHELRSAIARLGARRIGEIVTGLAVTRVFVPHTESQRALWIHALDVAGYAREIARQRDVEAVAPDTLYLAGLLHDLGRFVMFDESPNELDSVDETNWTTPDELVEAEKQICGFDHAELGWHACRRWGIPDAIANVVRDHHSYAPDGVAPGADAHTQATAVVQLADQLSVLLATRPELLEKEPEDLASALEESRAFGLWEPPLLDAAVLAERLPGLKAQADRLATDLGLTPTR